MKSVYSIVVYECALVEDFSEHGKELIYKEHSCEFVEGYKPKKRCKNLEPSARATMGACEQRILEEKVKQRLELLVAGESFRKHRWLGYDQSCYYTQETLVYQAMENPRDVNGYQFLTLVKKYLTGGICDVIQKSCEMWHATLSLVFRKMRVHVRH